MSRTNSPMGNEPQLVPYPPSTYQFGNDDVPFPTSTYPSVLHPLSNPIDVEDPQFGLHSDDPHSIRVVKDQEQFPDGVFETAENPASFRNASNLLKRWKHAVALGCIALDDDYQQYFVNTRRREVREVVEQYQNETQELDKVLAGLAIYVDSSDIFIGYGISLEN